MSSYDLLEEATTRLLAAVEEFEEAMSRRLQDGQEVEALTYRLQSLSVEHDRLAESLAAERQRAERLAAANDEVSQRLGTVIDSVRAIIQSG